MRSMLTIVLAAAVLCVGPYRAAHADATADAIKKAIVWLKDQQLSDGSYGAKIPLGSGKFREVGDVGITGLVITVMAQSPMALRPAHGPFMSRAVDYLLKNAGEDGSIANADGGLKNYKTSIALMALAAINDEGRYDQVIARAGRFVIHLQASEETGYDPNKHKVAYGGFGYDADLRPDLSNTMMSLQALEAAGVPKDSPVWARAVQFLSRCQNLSGSNDYDQETRNMVLISDGGMRYAPDESKAKAVEGASAGKRTFPSYLSMTYAGLMSFIYAQVDRNDPRVQAAYRWIRRNYSLDENSGLGTRDNPTAKAEGLYYCYHAMAKALNAYGEFIIIDRNGNKHNWAKELAERLLAAQNKDGWWVNDKSGRWWEDNKVLVTSYSVMALNLCSQNVEKQNAEIKRLEKESSEATRGLAEARTKPDNDAAIQRLQQQLGEIKARMADLKLHDKLKALQEKIGLLDTDRAGLENDLKEATAKVGARHPTVLELQQRLNRLAEERNRLEEERKLLNAPVQVTDPSVQVGV